MCLKATNRPPIDRPRSRLPALSGLLAALLALSFALPAPPARADERAEARRHFQTGMKRIAGGRHQDGIRELIKAYRLAPHPAVLYNIGRAYLEIQEYDPAIEYLVRYLTSDPPDREEVERLIQEAKAKQSGSKPAPAAAAGRPPSGAAPASSTAASRPAGPGATSAAATGSAAELRAMARQLEALADRMDGREPARSAPPEKGPASGRTAPPPDRTPDPAEAAPTTDAGSSPSLGPASPAASADPYAPVVVTSSRYSQSPLDAPSALYVLTADDIRRSGARTIPDLLRRVPGLEVMSMGPTDFNVGIRGFNAILNNKVLVLVDGRSLYLDFLGATFWPFVSISVLDIERIEVIRGPGAALYGANAFSGVINIITRSPGGTDDRSRVMARGGVPDWVAGDVHLTGRNGRTAWRASAGYQQAEPWSMAVDPDRADYQLLAPFPNLAARITRFDGRVDQRLGKRTWLSLSGGIAAGQTSFTAIGALRDFYVDGHYAYTRADLELPYGFSARGFWNRLDAVSAPWAAPAGSLDLSSHPRSDVFDLELEWHRDLKFVVDHRINAGLSFRYKRIDWEWLPGLFREPHAALFFQDEVRIAPTLSGVLSLRFDRHPVLAGLGEDASFLDRYPLSPRVAVIWRLAEGQALRATAGTAFRTPTFLENYISQPIPTSNDAVAVLNEGSRSLVPERILSAEVGYLNQPSDSVFEIEASAYASRVTHLVALSDMEPWPDPATQFDPELGVWYAGTTRFENRGEVYNVFGGEVGGQIEPIDGVDLYTNYAFSYIQQTAEGTSARATSTSPHKLNTGLHIRSKIGLAFGLDVHIVSAQTWELRSFDAAGQVVLTPVDLPAYIWMGLRLGYRTPDERLEVSVEGTNVLAVFRSEIGQGEGATPTPAGTHREHPLGQAVPPGLSGTLTWRF